MTAGKFEHFWSTYVLRKCISTEKVKISSILYFYIFIFIIIIIIIIIICPIAIA